MTSQTHAVTYRSARQYEVFRIAAHETNKFAMITDPVADGASFIQVIEIFDVGGKTPPNAHRAAQELFYVLYGEGIAVCNGQTIALTPGSSFLVRPGHTHVVENTGSTRLYCLTTMVPNEDFAQLIRAGVPDVLDAEDLRVLGVV
ncbi:MAG: cupin domain-containing protein [Burkholderiaceae bacterium]